MTRTFDKNYIGRQVEHSPYGYEPRLIPFGASADITFEAICYPAASVAVFIEDKAVGMIALAMGPEGGLFIGMEPDNLRAFGSSIMLMADKLDAGKGKQ